LISPKSEFLSLFGKFGFRNV